ncbi:hypothetical protein KKA47_03885 [bacterium]|nr:hypothetical protein [bacterium]
MWEACVNVQNGTRNSCDGFVKSCTEIPKYSEACVFYDSKPGLETAVEDLSEKVANQYNGASFFRSDVNIEESGVTRQVVQFIANLF